MVHFINNKTINITDFDQEAELWVYDELDDVAKALLIQYGLDLLVEIRLSSEKDDGHDDGQQEAHSEATEGDES